MESQEVIMQSEWILNLFSGCNGSAPWLDVGGEEEREIKDETQIPRKNVWCAIP